MDILEKVKLMKRFDKSGRELFIQVGALLILGLIMPLLINHKSLSIYEYLYRSVDTFNQGLLLIAAFMLVIMNSVRILPTYLAVFMLLEVVNKAQKAWLEKLWYIGVTVLIIPLEYMLINIIYGVRYHFGMPSIIIIIAMILFSLKEMVHISVLKKSMFIILLLIGIQWLDIVPMLSDYGFGYGEVSKDIKNISLIINADETLNFLSFVLFFIFTVNSSIIYRIFEVQNKALLDIDIKREMRKELHEAKLHSVKIHSMEETQNLVHDLKTPLTIIEMYASLIEMVDTTEKTHEYVQKITSSVDQLNHMISEILVEDKKRQVSVDELLSSVLSQISTYDLDEILNVRISCPDTVVFINKIRMGRAIVNIVKNAMDSVDKEQSRIDIEVDVKGDAVDIRISDNGKGIDEEVLSKIFERGYSTKKSSGIGLGFAKKVIENHNGSFEMYSKSGVGTTVVMRLPCEQD